MNPIQNLIDPDLCYQATIIRSYSSLMFFIDKEELTIEDKYKKTLFEIESLKEHLGELFFVTMTNLQTKY